MELVELAADVRDWVDDAFDLHSCADMGDEVWFSYHQPGDPVHDIGVVAIGWDGTGLEDLDLQDYDTRIAWNAANRQPVPGRVSRGSVLRRISELALSYDGSTIEIWNTGDGAWESQLLFPEGNDASAVTVLDDDEIKALDRALIASRALSWFDDYPIASEEYTWVLRAVFLDGEVRIAGGYDQPESFDVLMEAVGQLGFEVSYEQSCEDDGNWFTSFWSRR